MDGARLVDPSLLEGSVLINVDSEEEKQICMGCAGQTACIHRVYQRIAGGFEKGGYVTTCAEVAVNRGEVKVVRVIEAFDCGAVVNPQGLKNQIPGAVVQGLGGALFEAIHFENGRILNPHLADYRVPRFSDTPEIEVVLVDRKDQPSMGAGETPLVGIAPAVANAIFNAVGIRLRSLPLAAQGLPNKSV
jgi:isoquinoline 1-oxidoreductase